jgi:hypothetical protein
MAFGGIDLSIFLFFLLLNIPQEKYITYINIIKVVLSIVAITVAIWGFLWRKNARILSLALIIRFSLLATAFVLSQVHSICDGAGPSELWVAIALLIFIFSVFIYGKKESKQWDQTFKTWQKIQKVSIPLKQYRIFVISFPMTHHKTKMTEKGYIAIGVAAFGIFRIFTFFSKLETQATLFRFGSLFAVFVLGMGIGKFIAWTIKLIKTEKQLGFKFLTELADDEELERLSKMKL